MFINQAIHTLQSHGQKITKTRRRLLEKLASLHSPLNPYELLESDADAHIDITTIYRNLELFEKIGLVHKIHSIGGYMPCVHDHHHCNKVHDIIICQGCHSIYEGHIDVHTKKLFGLSDGPVELSGECLSCKSK